LFNAEDGIRAGHVTGVQTCALPIYGETFSEPLRVNRHPGSAIAIGNIRGAHLAVGKNGRVHVAWMGSSKATPKGPRDASPMLYRSEERRVGTEDRDRFTQ